MASVAGADAVGVVRSNIWTAVAVGLIAFASVDMAHEVLGHGTAALLVDGVTPVSLSTVALSSSGRTSRLVALAGPLLNLVLGGACLATFRRGKGFGPGAFFLWLFAVLNLFNGLGYAIYSGVLDFGDLAVVIEGWQPHAIWRLGMGVVGVAGYYMAVLVSARSLGQRLDAAVRDRTNAVRMTLPAYLAGSCLLLVAAALNPIPGLILLSGASSGFACMFGLLMVPAMLPKTAAAGLPPALGKAWSWWVAGIVVSAIFVLVIGPGISLSV